MRHIFRYLPPVFATTLTAVSSFLPIPARAQAYPVDCAILLCLSDGWPPSLPCGRARAEFIRRVTPWPVEPPLQIWRCPMAASYDTTPAPNHTDRMLKALLEDKGTGRWQSTSAREVTGPVLIAWRNPEARENLGASERNLWPVGDRADIDISGPEFDFVRSIRVFDVRYARQVNSGPQDSCRRSAVVAIGTYGFQGEFSWQESSIDALPVPHVGLERWGQNCPSIDHRSVFVDWHDSQGHYGFEQVDY